MSEEKTFGSFIRKKRLGREITLRGFAKMLDLSPVHMSNMETDRRAAPKDEVLARMAQILLLSKEETEVMYDLAAKSKASPRVSGDLPEYIMENDLARVALRTAKDMDATDKEWQEFIEKLRNRGAKEDG
ncbi:MAG: helix-turn-helix domain-containing protein [Oscillospiraceae bacterium]|jgi:transcriptional regulator with XRE-family HTH domain|nr:helix-turn-helix domain-containing protein [Oscillospiraceae bacterium]